MAHVLSIGTHAEDLEVGDQGYRRHDWYVHLVIGLMIGLPEYRNGGLIVDLGLLKLTDKAKSEAISESEGIYKFSPSSQTVIEWRAITVIALYVNSPTSCLAKRC